MTGHNKHIQNNARDEVVPFSAEGDIVEKI